MPLLFTNTCRFLFALLVCALFVSGCSSSNSDSTGSASDMGQGTTVTGTLPDDEIAEESVSHTGTTRVLFDITVPAYKSNELQVRLERDGNDLAAMWIADESWSVSDDLPIDSEHSVVVRFYDGNGDITLASVEKTFRTENTASQTVVIMADDFSTSQWDDDNDGVSNLDESRADSNPLADETLQPAQVSLELVHDKTVRISWQAVDGASFYRVLENADGVSGYTLISDDLDTATLTFDHRIALYRRINARYMVQSCNAGGCVDSDEQIMSGSFEPAIGYFKASNTGEGDRFGGAIALSADGTTLAVGAHFEMSAATGINGDQTDNTARWSGAVYLFEHINGHWHEQAYVKASNTGPGEYFGAAVSLNGDGNMLAVGAYSEKSAARGVNGDQNDKTAYGPGAAYIFTRHNGNWEQQAYLKASNTHSYLGAFFGFAVSLSADGSTLAVGDIWENSAVTGINNYQFDSSVRSAGAVYIFVQNGGNWQQQAYVKASNTDSGDYFGAAVALSADGNTLVAGADREQSSAGGVNGDQSDNSLPYAGAAYVFARSNGTWSQQAYLKARNPAEQQSYGRYVTISASGNQVAVGTWDTSVGIYERVDGQWRQQANLTAADTEGGVLLGGAVSLSADGQLLAIGSPDNSKATGINGNPMDDSAESAGAVYVFERNDGDWRQLAYLKSGNTEPVDLFGSHVAFSADGNTLAVGATGEDSAASGTNGYQLDNSVSNSGAVYLY